MWVMDRSGLTVLQELPILICHPDFRTTQFSSHDKLLATTSVFVDDRRSDTTIWDAMTGQEIAVLPRYYEFSVPYLAMGKCVTFSPDEKWIAVTNDDNTVVVWDTANGEKINTFGNGKSKFLIRAVIFSPDSQKVLVSTSNSEVETDNTVHLWDVTTGNELMTFSGHEKLVITIAFSPDGTRIVTGSFDGTVRVWDVNTGKQTTLPGGGHYERIDEVSFSQDSKKILVLSTRELDNNTSMITRQQLFDAITFELLSASDSGLFADNEKEIRAVMNSYGKKSDNELWGFFVLHEPLSDEPKIIGLNMNIHKDSFNDRTLTLYGLPVFADLDTLIRRSKEFLSRREWSCEERLNFSLDRTMCPESKGISDPLHTSQIEVAEAGSAKMQHVISGMYIEGDGVTKDLKEGIRWLRKAAEQGHAGAQTVLGYHYYMGDGMPQDYQKAVEWFHKAAAQGEFGAQGILCKVYFYGIDKVIAQDDKEAFKWCRKAAVLPENGFPQFFLGYLYQKGRGVAQNLQEAEKWYARAEMKSYCFLSSCFARDKIGLNHLVVTSVLPNSQAEKLGLKVGDIFIRYDGHPVLSTDFFISERNAEPTDGPAKELQVLRENQKLVFQITPGKLGVELKNKEITGDPFKKMRKE